MLGIMAGMVRNEQLCACSDLFKAGIVGGKASRAFAGMRGRLFGALCIGTGPGGRVHRGTAPIIRCICDALSTEMRHLHSGPHHNHHLISLRILGIQRRGDGKRLRPTFSEGEEVRWASLAIFFLALELGNYLHLGTLGTCSRRLQAGFRLVSPAEGTSALALVRLNQMHRACAWTDIRTLHTVRTTTTTPPRKASPLVAGRGAQ